MDNYRFNWGGPPVWETDERKILNVTARLSLELERHNDGRNTYHRIVRLFSECKQKDISNILTDLYEQLRNYKARNDKLSTQVQDLEKQLYDMSCLLRNTTIELKNISYDRFGNHLEQYKEMKRRYIKGASLRELAKIYGCDKSTVKRRLIKMGVTIRG